MNALTFLIRLTEPLLTTQGRVGEANSAVASPFISGGMIRGALVARYLDGRATLLAEDDEFRELFFSGKVCFLNAYPAHPRDLARSLPKPFSWLVPKQESHYPEATIHDFAIRPVEWRDAPKPPACGDFYWRQVVEDEDPSTQSGLMEADIQDIVELRTPLMQVTVHNAGRDRSRKDELNSDVFRYDAIAEGEVFAGAIISHDELLLEEHLTPLLEKGYFLLGRSTTGGYGKVEITDVSLETGWREYLPEKPPEPDQPDKSDRTGRTDKPTHDTIRLVCLSDLILRNRGRHVLEELQAIAGGEILRCFWRPGLVGGFNRKWGLPLLQAWSIRAGSVFVFPSELRGKLEPFIETGMGERHTEGYGRIALSCHRRPTLQQAEAPEWEMSVDRPSGHQRMRGRAVDHLTQEERELLSLMARRQLQASLDYELTEKAMTLSARLAGELPSPAQLSRARLAARRAWLRNDLSQITRHFESLSKLTIRKEWEGARIENEPLMSWILKLAQSPDDFKLSSPAPSVGGVSADLDSLRERSIARLLEAVLKQAVKKARKEKDGKNPGLERRGREQQASMG